ncbi:hypothetical protein CASFOL_013929 [Castilleja foliolosa]|uniref:Uncharacterized protein n=1 Tax=Castilleja foliolosa TaxID=1961234 RepID=A0ABD3DQ14_9LAMI
MAFSRNKNLKSEPAYGGATNYPIHMQRPMMFNKHGGQHAIVGHFAAQKSESFVLETHEEVVEFGSGDGHKYSPTKKEMFMDHGARDLSPYTPRSSTKRDEGLSPKLQQPVVYSRAKGSPVTDSYLKDKSPSPRNHHYYNTNNYGKFNHLISNNDNNDEDDNHDKSHNYKMNANSKESSYDEKNNKRNGYAPPANYTSPYHYKASYNNNNEKHIDNNNNNNNGYVHQKVKIIPQIKTRIGDPEFAKANTKTQMNFASPKKGQGYQEVIDSSEARRRYSGMPSTWAGQYVEEMYEGEIDCKEAARKYNGVFVPN